MAKQIILNAFDMTCAMHNSHGLWKDEENRRPREYKDLDYWIEVAKLLERGKFDAIFFADVAGIYDVYKNSSAPSLRNGLQVPLNDPAFAVPAMAAVTKNLSFAVTVSTTYDHPFAHARRFSTLDHLTKGRFAWNIVTSYLPNAAGNFGLNHMIVHDERYDIADEFLDVTYKLWEGSWEDGAVINDIVSDTFIDPAKVHKINHKGKYFSVEGPHLCDLLLSGRPFFTRREHPKEGRSLRRKMRNVCLSAVCIPKN